MGEIWSKLLRSDSYEVKGQLYRVSIHRSVASPPSFGSSLLRLWLWVPGMENPASQPRVRLHELQVRTEFDECGLDLAGFTYIHFRRNTNQLYASRAENPGGRPYAGMAFSLCKDLEKAGLPANDRTFQMLLQRRLAHINRRMSSPGFTLRILRVESGGTERVVMEQPGFASIKAAETAADLTLEVMRE